MKFLPESGKKRNWSIILLAVSVIGIVYFNVFYAAAPEEFPPLPPDQDPDILAEQTQDTSAGEPEAAAFPSSPAAGGILPYGSKLDTSLFDEERFKALRGAPGFTVSEDELGKEDLFQ